MKKILIVNKSFEVGGIQSSMVNMANELGKYYDVDLYLYNPVGSMKERLNDNINVLEPSWRFKSLGLTLGEAVKTKNIKVILFRLFATVWSKLFNNMLPINIAIRHQKKLTGYDLAIAYHQEQRKKSVLSGFSRFVDKCVDSNKKIAWLHFDSDIIDLDSEFNNQFYSKMDKIVCVSKTLMESFSRNNPDLSDKMDYCYNFMLYDSMQKKSLLEQEVPYPENRFVCFSACRLTDVKAIPRAVKALSDVLKKNPDVVWYIAGDGPERNKIESAIKEYGLEKQIVLIGMQTNPYPYIKNADLTLNVSYNEAAPMIFMESLALGTPVFATRTSSAEEMLRDNVDSFICENTELGIKTKFNELLDNRESAFVTKETLINSQLDNLKSYEKIKNYLM